MKCILRFIISLFITGGLFSDFGYAQISESFRVPEIKTSQIDSAQPCSTHQMRTPYHRVLAIIKNGVEKIEPDSFKRVGTTTPDPFPDSFWENEDLRVYVDTSEILAINQKPEIGLPEINLDDIESDGGNVKPDDSFELSKKLKDQLMKKDSLANEAEMDDYEPKHKYVEAYPVYIVNLSSETYWLASLGGSVLMIREAKTEEGRWKPIEYWEYPTCGVGQGYLAIEPNHFAFAKTLKYEGNFKTKMRLKLRNAWGVFYSNTFTGYIHQSQFKTKPKYKFSIHRHNISREQYYDLIFLDDF